MNEIKEDVFDYWTWAQEEFESDELNLLMFEVDSAITNLNKHINNAFKRENEKGKADLRAK